MDTLDRPPAVERLRIGILLPAAPDDHQIAYQQALELLRDYFPDGSSILMSATGPVVEGSWRKAGIDVSDRHALFVAFHPHPPAREALASFLSALEDELWNVYAETGLHRKVASVVQTEIFVEAWPAVWQRPSVAREAETEGYRQLARALARKA